MRYPAVPVVMYHSVGRINPEWKSCHLTCPWQVLEQHLKWLQKAGFHTVSLQQLYDYKKNGKISHDRPIVLTFDDGYLDNWIFAYPLLKRYGFTGVIFVSPEFVDPRDIVRGNLEDVWQGRERVEDLQVKGFLSWKEIELMEKEGIIDIQSHSMTHTWYFCNNEIIDFHCPGSNDYPWMFWNIAPERKHLYLNEEQDGRIPYGTPIYRHARSLGTRRYFEDIGLTKDLVGYVREKGPDFLNRPDWKKELYNQIEIYKANKEVNDRYETDEEQGKRFESELKQSKGILEEKLNKKVNFLCWPGGANTDISKALSHKLDYAASTQSVYREKGKNIFLEDSSKIYRISPPNIQIDNRRYYLGGLALVLGAFYFRGSFWARLMLRLLKSARAMFIRFGIKR